MEEDQRIFSMSPVEYALPSRLSVVAVSNNILFMALETMRLLRIDLEFPGEVEGTFRQNPPPPPRVSRTKKHDH